MLEPDFTLPNPYLANQTLDWAIEGFGHRLPSGPYVDHSQQTCCQSMQEILATSFIRTIHRLVRCGAQSNQLHLPKWTAKSYFDRPKWLSKPNATRVLGDRLFEFQASSSLISTSKSVTGKAKSMLSLLWSEKRYQRSQKSIRNFWDFPKEIFGDLKK